MDVTRILAELKAEREQIEHAIGMLERLAQGRAKRRGRPPAWLAMQAAAAGPPVAKRRGRPPGSKSKAQPPDGGETPEAGATNSAVA